MPTLKKRLQRFCTLLVLASVLSVVALVVPYRPTLAQSPCDPNAPIDATAGAGASCTMSISAQINSGGLTLANDAAATVPGSPFTLSGAPITASFNFTSVVKDHRGTTAGWRLQAALGAGGLTNGTTHLNLDLTAENSSCTNGTCAPVTFTPITLLAGLGSQTFLSAGDGTTVIAGDYTNQTTGAFTIPADATTGSYTGTVEMTPLNTF